MELMAQAPNQEAIQAAVTAHIQEHLAFKYREEIQRELGLDLPSMDTQLPPEIESKLSSLVAQAAEQLLQKDQAEAQQQQAEEQAADPILQLKQRELQIEEQAAAAKAQTDQQRVEAQQQKLALDAEKAQMRDELERLKIQKDLAIAQERIDSAERLAQAEMTKDAVTAGFDRNERLQKQRQNDAVRGADIGRKIAEQITKNT